ncbi:MAG: O-antigen ligase family protein [Elusimicrobia bacterium]|nr:O-antigen ligase family protein [Elusimicrobiota bacterium]MDE2509865.1 O-antigen ligase family protein [Elusimicrobiota bacterium]
MAEDRKAASRFVRTDAEAFAHKAITLWLPVLYFLISSLFFLRTYDSAQVKISVMQMGGVGLLTLWLCRLALAGRHAFNKANLIILSPFLAYLAVGIFSFLHAPYSMASTDFFLRHMFYMIVALIVIYEFDQLSVDRLINWLIWAAWVAIGYGTLQFVDARAFPPGVGNGIDPFVWRGAFGPRVFSTYGNPNFYGDFLVIIFPILLTQFLKTRRWSLVPLMAMLLLNLISTGTKGAWLGFAIVCALFGAVSLKYFKEFSRPYRAKILGVAAAGVLAMVAYTAKDLETRIVSINFRLFTWEATWDLITTQPWIGSGLGAFPPLYPAFRRPAIFHIEAKHNTETDHAEDEYLEEFLDNGILGFGIFLWLVFSTLIIGFRSLGQLTTSLALKDGRPPPRAYDLTGVLVSFCGMLGHNFFDVSMRFVSSGVYLGLLSGLIVNMARGRALYELHPRATAPGAPAGADEEMPLWKTLSEFLIWPARLAAIGGVVYYAFILDWHRLAPMIGFGGMFGEFSSLIGPLARIPGGGELLQWWLAWGTFAGCMLGLGYAMIRLCLLSENPVIPALVLACLQPLYMFWGYFKADIHHNVAIYFSKERQWDAAVSNYLTVNKLNPDFVMAKYFLGNVFNDRFNMTKVYNPIWGDTDNVPRDDYERALYWYNEVRRLSPNYVQMHHQVGNLHLRRAQWAMDPANHRPPEEVQHYLDLALNRFKLYRQIDPVFPPNYYRMGQIYIMRKQYDLAIKNYEDLIAARECAVDPKLLANSFLRHTILSYQVYVQEDGHWVHRHATPQEPAAAAEAYTALANAHYLAGHLLRAETFYKKALGFVPTFDNAKRNLEVVYRKAQLDGRLRKLPPPAKLPALGEPPFTGYEVAPAKK